MNTQSPASPSAPPRSPAKSWLTKRNVAIAVVLIFLLLGAAGYGASNQGTITKTATVTTSIVQTVTVTEGAGVTYTYVQTVTAQSTSTVYVTQGVPQAVTVYVTRTVTQQIATSAQTLGQGEWKTIETFTGSADRDTEDFNVPTNYWRIVYTIEAENEQYAGFYFFVYPSGETKSYVASVIGFKSGTDTTYVRAGPGDFWIKVLAANLRSWTIEVQIQQ